jgi:hypothetical protein
MAANMALKRARKAQRRKQVVAEKRRLELVDTGLAAQVRRAAEMPIQRCIVTEGLFDVGIGTLHLARGATPHQLTVGSFLVDPFCLGIKDAFVRSANGEEFAFYIDSMAEDVPLKAVEPSYARKLLRDAAAWAHSKGFAPHRDFAIVEQIFGDVDPAACDVEFRFGRDGEPVYVPGPSEPLWLIRQRQEQMRRLG